MLNFAIIAVYRRRAYAGERFSLEEEGLAAALPLRLAGLLVWGYTLFYMVAPHSLVGWSQVDLPAVWRWLGAGVALFVVPPLVIWAQRSLGRNVSPTVVTRKTHELVTNGPFRWVRHPLYAIGLLYFSALSLLASSWFLCLVTVLLFGLIIFVRIPQEEAKLVDRFGDAYRHYMQHTGRILPRFFD